ncbi:seipin-1-like [Andrographis paniculata]|uniref:seipin-1-like n=1 Tax=Andrographis paniculata TaxID=175694 RepID=UPI0021E82387|nr:seipin-1-like [Andrographis paniculata]
MPLQLITPVGCRTHTHSLHRYTLSLIAGVVIKLTAMDSDDDVSNHKDYQIPPSSSPALGNPLVLCRNLVSSQAELISISVVSLASPFLRRLLLGLLVAAYVCILLLMVMAAAAVLGVGLVRMVVEEPVAVRESLQLDYSAPHPTAVFSFRKMGGAAVPVGQTLHVSLLLVMPESDYNIDVGIFQLSAELISVRGELVAKSSHPYMLKFRSFPIRLLRTFVMGVPLLLGLTSETQTAVFPILKHKETSYPRTDKVRITINPRAGEPALPQLYEAQLVMVSRLPWMKALIYRWKWTLYVWTTLYIFVLFVMLLVVFLKPLVFPVIAAHPVEHERDSSSLGLGLVSREKMMMPRMGEERGVSESLRRWQRSRNKRKAALFQGLMAEADRVDSSASSIVCSPSFEEGSAESESVCFKE